jgi:hypothetical protein
MAFLPELDLRRAHLLIARTLLTLYDIDLASNSSSAESIRAQANAGIGKDKSVDWKANFNQIPIRSSQPAEWKEHLRGSAFWQSSLGRKGSEAGKLFWPRVFGRQ